jgi:salicylate hydroxylase
MFSSDYIKPMGAELKGGWVETVPKSEIEGVYSDMGNDVKIIVDHINSAGKWYIHQVSPTLQSFVFGKVVLVGDSVSRFLLFHPRIVSSPTE